MPVFSTDQSDDPKFYWGVTFEGSPVTHACCVAHKGEHDLADEAKGCYVEWALTHCRFVKRENVESNTLCAHAPCREWATHDAEVQAGAPGDNGRKVPLCKEHATPKGLRRILEAT